jgi:hypothetical protein
MGMGFLKPNDTRPDVSKTWWGRQSFANWSPIENSLQSGKEREFGGKRADFTKTGRQSRNDLNALRLNFPTQTIREFFKASRETAGNYF